MIERILEIMKSRNLTPSQFADEIGIQRSGLSHLISGRNKPSLEFLMKVLKRYPEIKADYLLYGSEVTRDEIPAPDLVVEKQPQQVNVPSLFDQLEVVQEKKVDSPLPKETVKERKSERKIEKIVIFYTDKTFSDYIPG